MYGYNTGGSRRLYSSLRAVVRHKCFISYHHEDADEVYTFVNQFDHEQDAFIYRGLGLQSPDMPSDIIDSDDTAYVMRRIRELYLTTSTVTLVMVGRCTWARRYVDWEIQASLRSGSTVTPNGLLAIELPSVRGNSQLPNRVSLNVLRDPANNNADYGFARYVTYPDSTATLVSNIQAAYDRRTTTTSRIDNPRDRFINNKFC